MTPLPLPFRQTPTSPITIMSVFNDMIAAINLNTIDESLNERVSQAVIFATTHAENLVKFQEDLETVSSGVDIRIAQCMIYQLFGLDECPQILRNQLIKQQNNQMTRVEEIFQRVKLWLRDAPEATKGAFLNHLFKDYGNNASEMTLPEALRTIEELGFHLARDQRFINALYSQRLT